MFGVIDCSDDRISQYYSNKSFVSTHYTLFRVSLEINKQSNGCYKTQY